MFSHIVVGSNDLEASRRFYDAIFAAMGGSVGVLDGKGRWEYLKDGGRLLVTRPIDGKPATFANGGTVAFRMASSDMVAAWHAAGISNGGTSAEDPPGIRQTLAGRSFLAYLRDPDGNKLCAAYRFPAEG